MNNPDSSAPDSDVSGVPAPLPFVLPMSGVNTGEALSPEAEAFLTAAALEFNDKQDALDRDWQFGSHERWDYDQYTGLLRLYMPGGAELLIDGQILGTYLHPRNSWEWAWNNPEIEAPVRVDSQRVLEQAKQMNIAFLQVGIIGLPNEDFTSYLAAIGVKTCGALGIYRAQTEHIDIYILVKNPRRVPATPLAA